jgi:Rieske 2Fe-2S family protein
VICPYHSWSYTLEGQVWTAPGFKEMEGFDPAEHGLTELPLVEWHGLVFVNASGTAAPLAESLAMLGRTGGAL